MSIKDLKTKKQIVSNKILVLQKEKKRLNNAISQATHQEKKRKSKENII